MKRRGRGEGSIFKDSKDRWVAELTLPDNKKRRKYAKTYKEAKDWLEVQKHSVKEGVVVDSKSTVKEFLDRYLSDIASTTLRPRTYESYEMNVRLHIVPAIGKVKLASLTPAHLQSLYTEKLSEGLSRRTVQYLHAIIHKSLNQALKWGLVVRNIADAVDPPKPERKVMDILSTEQVLKFLEAVKDHRWYPIYLTLVTSGARIGEVLGISGDALDLDNGIIYIKQTVQQVNKKGMVIAEPKTDQSRRPITVPDVTVEVLRPLKKQGLIFVTKNGNPISSRNVLRHFQMVCEELGFPRVTIHSLRHFHSTFLLSQREHPKVVQERLGHTRISTTIDLYSHSIPSMQKEASDKIGNIFKV